jgi:hypothetical protein
LTEQNQKQLGKTLWNIAAQTHKKGLMQRLFPSLEEPKS